MNDDIDDIAGGDNDRTRMLRDNLARLTHGPDPLLREMATGVLDGDVRLRDAAASDVYSEAITDTFRRFWTGYQDMTPEERADLIARGHDQIARVDEAGRSPEHG